MVSLCALLVVVAATDGQGARETLATAGLEVSGPLSDGELQAMASALDALPAKWRALPAGQHVRLALDDTRAPTATGIAEPEWSGDDFQLRPQLGHATYRDGSLDDDARRALWRARAVVHVLLSRWDDVEHWSLTPTWRRTNGWLLPFERPLSLSEHSLNQASTAWARPRGAVSAKLDFLTFAEAALVPVTSLATDDLLRCQDFTRLRALGALLGQPWAPGACPAFDEWVRLDELEHLEVLLVQASGRAPESLFGHLLVRPVWKTSLGPSFDTAIQFAAITAPKAGPAHLAKGLFGGYSIGVFTISMTDLLREKLSGEQRTMTRWKLSLSKAEMRRFLERAWEFERRGKFAYAFFSDNCATLLVWMLESALDDPTLVRWPGFITSPGGVLDELFRARRADGARLLTPLFPSFESTERVARRDDARRRVLEDSLALSVSTLRDEDPTRRAAAYVELAHRTRARPDPALFEWWALSARVERAAADRALHSLRELEDELIETSPVDLERLWAERLQSLERESVLQQQMMLLDRESFQDELRRRANKRAPTAVEAKEQAELESTLALFTQVTTAQGALVSEVFPDGSADAFLEAERAASIAEEVPPVTRSLPVSGHWRTGLGAGLWRRDDGTVTPVVQLDEAGLLELLGEQRLRGLGGPVGVRMLEGSLTLAPSLRQPEIVQSHFTLVAFDSIARAVPPAPRWKDHLGFGFEAATDFRAWRSQHTLYGGAGWVLAHVQSAYARNLLALGVGPAVWAAVDGRGVMPVGGVSTRLVARVALQREWPSSLRLEARHQSLWGPGRAMHELRADAALEWVVAWGGRPRVLVRPTVSVTAEPTLARLNAAAVLMLEPAESLADVFRVPHRGPR